MVGDEVVLMLCSSQMAALSCQVALANAKIHDSLVSGRVYPTLPNLAFVLAMFSTMSHEVLCWETTSFSKHCLFLRQVIVGEYGAGNRFSLEPACTDANIS